MPVDSELNDLLACPKCKGKLEVREAAGAVSAFVCRACKLVYPVVDDIPNFIIEEAQPLAG